MARISNRRIVPNRIISDVTDDTAGGTVVFIGTVRNHHRGTRVVGLEYEAYVPMAESMIERIEKEARRKWPINQISIIHRKGRLKVGDVSVVIAVSSEHRAEAFEACRFAIESLKRTVPIWKREATPGGRTDWIEGDRIEELVVTENKKSRGPGSHRRRPPA